MVGGAVEPDETPAVAALREAKEEVALELELTRLIAALGGPEFRVTYPNGDVTAYVMAVYEARVTGGLARPDGCEVLDVAWVAWSDLHRLSLEPIAEHTLRCLEAALRF